MLHHLFSSSGNYYCANTVYTNNVYTYSNIGISGVLWFGINGFSNLFGKNLALSYQNNRKTSSINACGLMAERTHTHTQVKSPPSDPCAFYQT